jgi:hypothetical protein
LVKAKYSREDGTMYRRLKTFERLMIVCHSAQELTAYLGHKQCDASRARPASQLQSNQSHRPQNSIFGTQARC